MSHSERILDKSEIKSEPILLNEKHLKIIRAFVHNEKNCVYLKVTIQDKRTKQLYIGLIELSELSLKDIQAEKKWRLKWVK